MPTETMSGGKHGGECASPSVYEKKRAHKWKNKYVHFSTSKDPETLSCMIHDAEHSSEKCRFLKEYVNKYKNQTDSLGKKRL